MSDDDASESEPVAEPVKEQKRSRRGRRGKEPVIEIEETAPAFEIEFDNSGFERISDNEDEDTGEMFKDAYMQEAIVDRVRAAEFDMESIAEAEVGSLLADVDER